MGQLTSKYLYTNHHLSMTSKYMYTNHNLSKVHVCGYKREIHAHVHSHLKTQILKTVQPIMTERQAILKTALPSYFLVKFHVDETLCVIPKKNLVDPTHLQVGGSCNVKWNSTEVLEATIVAMGEKGEMLKAEKEQIMNMENQAEQQPPSKK